MKIAKKLSALLLAVIMLFSMIACDGIFPNKDDSGTTVQLVLEADKTTVNPGKTVTFSSVLKDGEEVSTPNNTTYSITEGADYATISGNTLTVNENVPNNAEIKVVAKSGDVTSNTVVVTVVKPLSALNISADKSGEVDRGTFINLSVTKTPDYSEGTVSWVVENKLFINGDAIGGTVIKVKAVCGTVESNVLTFTVKLNQQELNNSSYIVVFDDESVVLDKNGLSSPTLNVTVYNGNYEEVTDQIIDYVVLEGDEFLSISQDGNACALTAIGHGTATVKATIRGTSIAETATVNVIVPPTAINLPEVLRERPNHNYSFSAKNPSTNEAYTLPFETTVVGDNVCTDTTVSFTHADGTTGDSVATYANSSITFLKEGLVTVTVTSNSGSRYETSVSYTFDVNNGYNVSTFEELVAIANDPAYTGSLPINLVVTKKPVGADKTYGYDLVPATALLAKADQSFGDVIDVKNTVRFINKGVIINGNFHKIDASELRVPTSEEITTNGGSWGEHNALVEIFPAVRDNASSTAYKVELYNLTVIGNCPIDFETTSHKPGGVYNRGIMIGSLNDGAYPANYYLTAKNVQAEAFRAGMRLLHIVDGRMDNTKVDNCFGNGLEIGGSILTLNNTTYGACGATGIEIVPEQSNMAGLNRNMNQQVTYAGSVELTFLNNFYNPTKYMQNYKAVGDYTVPIILNAAITDPANALTNKQVEHFMNTEGFVGFVTFKFHDIGSGTPNTSEIIYPGFQAGGIINARDLPTDGVDTTHEYIELDVVVTGLGNAGKAYFYNLNYNPNN